MYEKMSKIFIFTSSEKPDALLEFAWELKCIHLIPITNEELEDVSFPQYKKEELEFKISKFKEFSAFFESYADQLPSSIEINQKPIERGAKLFQSLVDQFDNWKSEMNVIDQRREIFNQYETILRQFEGIVPELSPDSLLEVRGIIIRNSTPQIEDLLIKYLKDELDNEFEIQLSRISDKLTLGSILYPKEYSDKIRIILDTSNISDIPLPKDLKGDTLSEKIRQLFKETKDLQLQQEILLEKLMELHQNYLRLLDYSNHINEQYVKGMGINFLKKSENFTVLTGYVPTAKITEIDELASQRFGKDIIIQYDHKAKETPTKFMNPHGVEEFQVFTEMLPPLKAGTVDPTWLIFMFFPFFYGFIVGDIGYGLIITVLGYFVYNKYRSDTRNIGIKRLGWVLFLSGIVTIIFGFLFGEFFGNLGEHFGLHPIWFHRGHDLMYLLVISIVIGIIHITLGLMLGIYNGLQVGHTKIIRSNSGLLFMYLGALVYGLTWYLNSTSFGTSIISSLFLLLGLILVVQSEGFIGIIESLSTIGNMLSYARLMALGAASVILADLANDLYFTVGGGIAGLLVTILLHILNIALALFSPTIHSMRLHLVEFFNKFVEFGSIQFKPFGVMEQFQNY